MLAARHRLVAGSLLSSSAILASLLLSAVGTRRALADVVAVTAPNPAASWYFGWHVAGLGDIDIDGDGHGDILASTPFEEIGQTANQGLLLTKGDRGELACVMRVPERARRR